MKSYINNNSLSQILNLKEIYCKIYKINSNNNKILIKIVSN